MEGSVWIVVPCMGFCVKKLGWSFGMRRVERVVLSGYLKLVSFSFLENTK